MFIKVIRELSLDTLKLRALSSPLLLMRLHERAVFERKETERKEREERRGMVLILTAPKLIFSVVLKL